MPLLQNLKVNFGLPEAVSMPINLTSRNSKSGFGWVLGLDPVPLTAGSMEVPTKEIPIAKAKMTAPVTILGLTLVLVMTLAIVLKID
jgi:hypothetical protein